MFFFTFSKVLEKMVERRFEDALQRELDFYLLFLTHVFGAIYLLCRGIRLKLIFLSSTLPLCLYSLRSCSSS